MQIEWSPYPADGRYLISSIGEVYSLISDRLLSQIQVGAYAKVWISGKFRFCHNLVLETFIGPRPPGLVARHLNGQHWDNDLFNLSWGTQKENVEDSRIHGTFRKLAGSECAQSKLTYEQAQKIRKLYAAGQLSQDVIAAMFGISQGRVSSIVRLKSYRK